MPYKDPQKAKESAKRRYRANKEKRKAYAKQWYYDNRETVLKQHKDKTDELKANSKEWRDKNKEYVKQYKSKNKEKSLVQGRKDRKKATDKLTDWYVAEKIKIQTGLSMKAIRENPDLIENHRQQIKLKRLLRNIKNGRDKEN